MFLIDIAHAANPPDRNDDWWGGVVLPSRDGWKVCFFYDCGELDHISHIITPLGDKLDVWPDDYRSDPWPPIMMWGRTSDTEIFRATLLEDGLS